MCRPAHIIDSNRRPVRGITAWADTVEQDDICSVGEMRLTDPLHHTDPDQLRKDIARMDEMMEMGWIVIRVTARDTPAVTVRNILRAWALRS